MIINIIKTIICLMLFICISLGNNLRIISTAPSITETIFLLKAESSLVGVSKYCNYPLRAKTYENIGGFVDFNSEKIIMLKPDYVLLLNSNAQLISFLNQQNIKYRKYDNESVEGIFAMIKDIGILCNKENEAKKIVADMGNKLSAKNEATSVVAKTKIILVFEQVIRNTKIQGLYIMGNDKFYSDLLQRSGFTNAYTGKLKYPLISPEGIIKLNPEALIILEPGLRESYQDIRLQAIKNNKLFFLADDFYKRPGPRFYQILEGFRSIKQKL